MKAKIINNRTSKTDHTGRSGKIVGETKENFLIAFRNGERLWFNKIEVEILPTKFTKTK